MLVQPPQRDKRNGCARLCKTRDFVAHFSAMRQVRVGLHQPRELQPQGFLKLGRQQNPPSAARFHHVQDAFRSAETTDSAIYFER
jgi:hypothetical protein